ncbi:MAG: hypothetical protein ABIH24_07920 [Verrucomicrobiota bacterium]
MQRIIPLPGYITTHQDARQSCSDDPIRHPASTIFRHRLTGSAPEAGMILVTVLLFMAIILALVIQVQVAARMALRFEERQSLRAQLRIAASEAAWDALRVLTADDNLQVDHTNEPWAAWQTNCLPNNVTTVVLITDENRYFNVNNLAAIPVAPRQDAGTAVRLPAAIVQDIFAASNWPDPVGETQALQDWVDRDLEGMREAGYYHQAHRAWEPPNAPIESPAELDGILNVTRAERRAAPQSLTVLPTRVERIVPINVNTVGREVLQGVLGAGRSVLAEKICRWRDAHPVTDLHQLMDAKTLANLRPYLDTRSRYFSLAAQADRSGQQETIYALVRRDDHGEVEILRWVQR